MGTETKIPWADSGRTVTSHGYVLRRVGKKHHLADVRGYAYEHRLAAEMYLGRRLESGDQVHHIDGNNANNDIHNLEVVCGRLGNGVRHRQSGRRLRFPGEPNPVIECGCGCGAQFKRFDVAGRSRQFLPGHNMCRKDRGYGVQYGD